MAVNAKQVKELREKTGAGMLDCKKHSKKPVEDIDKAIDYLREKGCQLRKRSRVAVKG